MNDWDATNYAAKQTLLLVLRREADALFEMAENGPWTAKTACTEWETRDIVGHLIDVTESYFVGFDAARSGASVDDPLGVRVMHDTLYDAAKEHRTLSQAKAVERLRTDVSSARWSLGLTSLRYTTHMDTCCTLLCHRQAIAAPMSTAAASRTESD
jgi:hypothetical protein